MFSKALCFLALVAASSAACGSSLGWTGGINSISGIDGCGYSGVNGWGINGFDGYGNGIVNSNIGAVAAPVVATPSNRVVANNCRCTKTIVVPRPVQSSSVVQQHRDLIQTGSKPVVNHITYSYTPALNAGPAISNGLSGYGHGVYGVGAGIGAGISVGGGLGADIGLNFAGSNGLCSSGLLNTVSAGSLGFGLVNSGASIGGGCGLGLANPGAFIGGSYGHGLGNGFAGACA